MLSESAIRRALLHLTAIGDTDIFPSPFEFKFYQEQPDKLVPLVQSLNAGAYKPKGCVEVLSPKGSLSFRIVHQLYPADSVLYTSAVLEIAQAVEALRQDKGSGPFSYRFESNDDEPRFFQENSSYHDWVVHLSSMYKGEPEGANDGKFVIETDISDFYSRIYFHRIEHVLDDVEASNAVRKIIEGVIKFSRGRQSHGLPVGSAASRVLAEGLLNDTDITVLEDCRQYSRYVDDFRMIADDESAAHALLCQLASHLMLTEGLSLNSSKTRIYTVEKAVEDCDRKLSDVLNNEEVVQVSQYIRRVYDDEDVSVEEIDDVDPAVIVARLSELMAEQAVDYGAIRVLMRAIRATGYENPAALIGTFGSLLYYLPRDFCMMAGALAQRVPDAASEIADALIEQVTKTPADQMVICKSWVAQLFITQAVPITRKRLNALNLGQTTLERRALMLLKGLVKDRSFFRSQKTSFNESSDWVKGALLFGASCLSRSEYRTWLSTVASYYDDIFSEVYLKWLRENQDELFDKIREDYKIASRVERMVAAFAEIFATDDDSPAPADA